MSLIPNRRTVRLAQLINEVLRRLYLSSLLTLDSVYSSYSQQSLRASVSFNDTTVSFNKLFLIYNDSTARVNLENK